MKKNATILITFTSIVLLLTIGSLILRNRFQREQDFLSQTLTENVKGITNLSNIPVVKNIAPTNAYYGQVYTYDLAIMDSDSPVESLEVSVFEGPSWLKVSELSIIGIPPFYALPENKVVLKVSDGENYSLFTYYLLVSNPDENN